jgi:23S rRNA (uracil1939-C5)-methyltransferase
MSNLTTTNRPSTNGDEALSKDHRMSDQDKKHRTANSQGKKHSARNRAAVHAGTSHHVSNGSSKSRQTHNTHNKKRYVSKNHALSQATNTHDVRIEASHRMHRSCGDERISARSIQAATPNNLNVHAAIKGKIDDHNVRIADVCPVAHTCGACSLVDTPYTQQLADKQKAVARLFEYVADEDCILEPILGMEHPCAYRNKIVSPFAPDHSHHNKSNYATATQRSHAQSSKKDSAKHNQHATQKRSRIRCGIYAAHSHHLIPIDCCPVEHPAGRRIVAATLALMMRYDMEPYDEDSGCGFMRHIVIRVGQQSDEILVTLVTNGERFVGAKNFVRQLVHRCPEITTVVQNINTRATNAIFGDREKTLYGPGFILDTLCGLSFRISSHSFYQVNAVQTEVLYQQAMEYAGLGEGKAHAAEVHSQGLVAASKKTVIERAKGDVQDVPRNVLPAAKGDAVQDASQTAPAIAKKDVPQDVLRGVPQDASLPIKSNSAQEVLAVAKGDVMQQTAPTIVDAYCGTGTIGLVAASYCPKATVIGVDSVASSIRDARQNAQHNNLMNAQFVVGDAGSYMRSCAEEGLTPDILFMDPPRSGADTTFIDAAVSMQPRRIVYISCNPETQQRDIELFTQGGYHLQRIRPVDMFPHTEHVETVCLLEQSRC